MKRLGNLFTTICSLENLQLADTIAQRRKSKQPGVIEHIANKEENLLHLQQVLLNKTYRTSPYTRFTIFEPKEREIFRLPYYPDRIVHHAIMNVLEDILVSTFTADTYSCIKGRGIHAASEKVKKALLDKAGTQYCLKMDIKKFYPSVNHDVLKQILRRKIKDKDLLHLLDEIIDSADGLPIGNYLSQYFSNLFMSGFDHWIKETEKVKYYFRYADDLVILSDNKPYLHQLRAEISNYLQDHLKLTIKDNYQVFPVNARGVDFVGYVHWHGYTLMRKHIKCSFARAVANGSNAASIASYMGWAKHCNSKHLLKKLSNHETIQRLTDIRRAKALHRRQDRYGQGIQCTDRSARLQDNAIGIHGKVPLVTDQTFGRDESTVLRIEKVDRANGERQQGRFAF